MIQRIGDDRTQVVDREMVDRMEIKVVLSSLPSSIDLAMPLVKLKIIDDTRKKYNEVNDLRIIKCK